MRDALYARANSTLAGPLTLSLPQGAAYALSCASENGCAAAALMAAGILAPTSGTLFVGGFDPRIQPVQVKRIAGYVPHEPVPNLFPSFERYVQYRAALWGLEYARAIERARNLLDMLGDLHEAFAYPLVGALLPRPRLLVLDRPQAASAGAIARAAHGCAILSTHRSRQEARCFRAA